MIAKPDQLAVTVLTHRGAVRDHNEDAVTVGALLAAGANTPTPVTVLTSVEAPVVVAVADGLGGHSAGEVASRHVALRLSSVDLSGVDVAAIAELISALDAEITTLGTASRDLNGMGTTVAGLVLTPDDTIWFNVGDSRVFREDGGYLGQLSADDSPTGARTDGEAVVTNVVTQTLGGGRQPVRPHVGIDSAERSGRWLICSDGLTDLVSLAEIEALLLKADGDDSLAVRALWAAAMNAGGHDNITIALVRRRPASAQPLIDAGGEPMDSDS